MAAGHAGARRRTPARAITRGAPEGTPHATRRRMKRCECCGNEYDKAFEVVKDGVSHVFDSFECAAHTLCPRCVHCGVTILGHGVEAGGSVFCCAHCARAAGEGGVRDRA